MALSFNDDQAPALLTALGLPDDTTDIATILATVTDAVGAATDDPKPSAVAAAAKRIGFEVVEAADLESLRREATEGRQLKASVERQKVEESVDDAVRKGKIAASRRKHWVSLIAADPGMAEVLASVPNETAVPMTEIGHGVGSEGNELASSAEWFR